MTAHSEILFFVVVSATEALGLPQTHRDPSASASLLLELNCDTILCSLFKVGKQVIACRFFSLPLSPRYLVFELLLTLVSISVFPLLYGK